MQEKEEIWRESVEKGKREATAHKPLSVSPTGQVVQRILRKCLAFEGQEHV